MLKNDESKRLAIRFKKSKDFYKTIEKLKEEGYTVYYNEPHEFNKVNGEIVKEKIILVGRGYNLLCTIYFEDNNIEDSEYKQSIICIQY